MTQDVFTEAMSDIMEDNDIGVNAVYAGNTIRALFQNGFLVIDGVETTAVMAECLDEDIPGVNHGSVITINGITYTVIGIQPTGQGATKLILSEDPRG